MSVQNEIEITGEPTAVYRLFAADGVLLYVGTSGNLPLRFRKHASDKDWWPQVARKTMVWYGSRREALAAEARAILVEAPLRNDPEKTTGPVARRFLATAAPEYAYVQVADLIEAKIRAGELAAGSRLPGEIALRAEYGVSLSTVRRATQILRERGLVGTRPVKGTFITWNPLPART
jgi:GntR family transcriptional regulator